MPQYAILIRPGVEVDDQATEPGRVAHDEHAGDLEASGSLVGAWRLAPAQEGVVLRGRGGEMPLAEAVEQVAGFYLVEADDDQAAMRAAQANPALAQGGSLEVRRVEEGTGAPATAPSAVADVPEPVGTRFAVLLVDYADPARRDWNAYTAEEQQQVMEQHVAFARAVAARPGCRIVAGEALAGGSDAVVLRPGSGGMVVTEGSFAEAVEQVGGLYLIDAPDLATLVELLGLMPTYVFEVRPTVEA